MRTSTAGLVVEQNDVRSVVERIGTVRPQTGMFGFAAAGIELAHKRLVGMQTTSFPEQFSKPIGQRL